MKTLIFLIVVCCVNNVFAEGGDKFIKQDIAKEKREQKREFAQSLRLEIAMEKAQNRRDRIEYGKYIYIYIPFYVGSSYSSYRFSDDGSFHYHYSY